MIEGILICDILFMTFCSEMTQIFTFQLFVYHLMIVPMTKIDNFLNKIIGICMIYSISKLIRGRGLSFSTSWSGFLLQLERFNLPSFHILYKLFNGFLRHFFRNAIVQILELLSRFDKKQEMFFRIDLYVI